MILFTIIPLFLIGFFAFTDASGDFTVSNVNQAIKYMPALVKSISLAAIATVLCLVLAYRYGSLPCFGISLRIFHVQTQLRSTEDDVHAHYASDVDEFPSSHVRMAGYS